MKEYITPEYEVDLFDLNEVVATLSGSLEDSGNNPVDGDGDDF